MKLDVARYSAVGGRAENEDAALFKQGAACCAAAVADGLGGHGGGAAASAAAMRCLEESLAELAASEAAVRALCERMNEAVLARQTPGCRMRTTLAMALMFPDASAVFAHIGDSRVYHFRDGRILYQSLDHSVSQAAVMTGEITAEQLRFHEDRNRVLRALGSDGPVRPEIRTAQQGLRHGDALLLCTDGFWEYVLEADMLEALRGTDSAGTWLGRMLDTLGARAGADNDNHSAVAVRVPAG